MRWACGTVLVGALAALGTTTLPDDAELTIELVDADGRPLPGLIRLEDAGGKPVALRGLLSRGDGLNPKAPIRRWWVLPKRTTLRLPAGTYTLEAFHGLETRLVSRTVKTGRTLRVTLERFHDPGPWRAGNTHLHLRRQEKIHAERYLREISAADGLDVVFVSHLERDGDDAGYVSNSLTRGDLERLSDGNVLFGNGEEHRHNFAAYGEGYGHVMLLDLRKLVQPVSIGPGIMKKGTDGIPLRRGIETARADGAAIVWCHNSFGLEDIPNWFSGRVHAQNIFDGGTHGSYKDTFYRYLNAALRVPFSTGTDWFIYDFNRVYVPVAKLESPKDFLRELRAGRSFITNGPLLEFTVNGEPIGSVLREAKGVARGRAAGRVDFRRLELVRNGEVVASVRTVPRDGYFEAVLEHAIEGPCWMALRIPPPGKEAPKNELGRALFAHTSPVYVGGRVMDPATVKGLLDEVRRARRTVEEKALFADDAERRAVLAVYDEGIAALEGMLK